MIDSDNIAMDENKIHVILIFIKARAPSLISEALEPMPVLIRGRHVRGVVEVEVIYHKFILADVIHFTSLAKHSYTVIYDSNAYSIL